MISFIDTAAICVKRGSSIVIEFREPERTVNEISQEIRREASQRIKRLSEVANEFRVLYVSRLVYKEPHIIDRPHIIWCINYLM